MLKRIESLENDLLTLKELVEMIDSYSKHFMSQTLTIITIVIAIAGIIIIGAAYFMIKSMVNQKMDNEIEKRILKILGRQPPVFYAKGEEIPNANSEIILDKNIVGLNDLEPNTLLVLEAKVGRKTIGQLSNSLSYHLIINSKGERVIVFDNYHHGDEPDKGNGQVAWVVVWLRKYNG